MGKHSKKTISDARQGSESERSGQCSDWDNPEQRSLAEGEATGKEGTSLDGINYEEIETYHKGFQRGYRLGYKQMKDFYEAKIAVLEKQVAHWKELAKR